MHARHVALQVARLNVIFVVVGCAGSSGTGSTGSGRNRAVASHHSTTKRCTIERCIDAPVWTVVWCVFSGTLLWQHLKDLPNVAKKLVDIASSDRSYWYKGTGVTYTGPKVKANIVPSSSACFQSQASSGSAPNSSSLYARMTETHFRIFAAVNVRFIAR